MGIFTAKETLEEVEMLYTSNKARFELEYAQQIQAVDTLGNSQIAVLRSFDDFTNVFEKIRGEVNFEDKFGVFSGLPTPKINFDEIKAVSKGALVLQNIIKSSTSGVAGGFAVSGIFSVATAASAKAVTALGVPAALTALSPAISQGLITTGVLTTASAIGNTAIASSAVLAGSGVTAAGNTALSSALATSAATTGASAAGGAAVIALLTNPVTIAATAVIGTIVYTIGSAKQSKQADEAKKQVLIQKESIDKCCAYLHELGNSAYRYNHAINNVYNEFNRQIYKLKYTVDIMQKTDNFNKEEHTNIKCCIHLVNLLNEMCKVKLVIISEDDNEPNKLNKAEIDKTITESESTLYDLQHVSYSNY
jgi:hypothetical protein